MEKFKTNPFIFTLVTALLFCLPIVFISCSEEPLIQPSPAPTTPNNNGNGKPTYCDTCLPPITQQGYNFFGCKINGKNWTPKDGFMRPGLRADINMNKIQIITINSVTKNGISIGFSPVTDTLTEFFPSTKLDFAYGLFLSDDGLDYFLVDTLNIGYIQFTRVDYQHGIFSGTFAFDVYNTKGDTLHFTDGRFDIKK